MEVKGSVMNNDILSQVFNQTVYWTEVLPIRPNYTRVHFDQERYLPNVEDTLTTELQIKYNLIKDNQ